MRNKVTLKGFLKKKPKGAYSNKVVKKVIERINRSFDFKNKPV